MTRKIWVQEGSLTEGKEDLLVNAANTNVALGSGVSGAIRRACGRGYQDYILGELEKTFHGSMVPGQVLLTNAGEHPVARYVAHVAVMDYREGFTRNSFPDLDLIETCCRNLWSIIETIDDAEHISVAMVGLGSGTGQLGVRHPTEIACRTLKAHLETVGDRETGRDRSRIGDIVFYGFQAFEYLTMVEVVSSFFDLPRDRIPRDLRESLEKNTRER